MWIFSWSCSWTLVKVLSCLGRQAFCWTLVKFTFFRFMLFVALFSVICGHIRFFIICGSFPRGPNGLYPWVILTCGRETLEFGSCFWFWVFSSPKLSLIPWAFMIFRPYLTLPFFPSVACWYNCTRPFHWWDRPYLQSKSWQSWSWTWWNCQWGTNWLKAVDPWSFWKWWTSLSSKYASYWTLSKHFSFFHYS